MKQIKLKNLSQPDKQSAFTDHHYYWVNLGNGVKRKFSNKKEARAFLSEVSRILTYKMYECSELYISIFAYYRRAWFYFDHNPETGQHNHAEWYKTQRRCRDSMEMIDNSLELIYRAHQGENGNYLIFNNFYTLLDAMDRVVNNLGELYANKGHAGTIYELEILARKVGYCRRTIENYTLEVENEFKEAEKIELKLLKTGSG